MKRRVGALCVLVAVVIACSTPFVLAVSEGPAAAQKESAPPVDVLEEKIESLESQQDLMLTILLVVLGLGTFASLFGFIKTERRATETHALAMTGERSSQARSAEVHETFLSGSKNTLDLVNATLTLAKDASERAAKTIESKALVALDKLDLDAKDLIAEVLAEDDDRALVADPVRRSELRSLAQRIAGFEINRLILPTEIRLTPHCMFIRGIDFHLSQQFEDAFDCWRDVALREDGPDALKSLASYWIGYEQNNLGNFGDARRSFDRALETAEGSRRYELQRISIESRFFAREPTAALRLSEWPRKPSSPSLSRTNGPCTVSPRPATSWGS